jgi:hypothetical protein
VKAPQRGRSLVTRSNVHWLERNADWALLALGVIFIVFGFGYLAGGAHVADAPDYALSVTGMTNGQLAAQSGDAYRLIEDQTRASGIALAVIGVLSAAIVLYGFRRNQRWAWWVLWSLPAYIASQAFLHIVDTVPGQTRPGPAFTSLIVSALVAGLLIVSAPRFFTHASN